jgi:hypothetical protein
MPSISNLLINLYYREKNSLLQNFYKSPINELRKALCVEKRLLSQERKSSDM